jgi:hypothetical protein
MKKLSPIWRLKIIAVSLGLCGLSFAIGGVVLHSYQRDIQEIFESGKWSLGVLLSQVDIRSKSDLDSVTQHEGILLTAVANTNNQCSKLAKDGAEVSIIYAFTGIGILISVFCMFYEIRKLDKQLAEPEHWTIPKKLKN